MILEIFSGFLGGFSWVRGLCRIDVLIAKNHDKATRKIADEFPLKTNSSSVHFTKCHAIRVTNTRPLMFL